jgi:hypothetical protein
VNCRILFTGLIPDEQNLRCDPDAHCSNPVAKSTPPQVAAALGNAPVKMFPLKPGEKVEF